MHPYSVDTNERTNILLFLAIISILSTWFFHKTLFNFKIVLPWWFEYPSILTFYGLLFVIFDRFCWKWKVFQKTTLIKTPDLDGKWKGFIQSSFDKHSSKIDASLEIHQSWTKIKILLFTEQSVSYSESASIIANQPEAIFLSYQYLNEPKANSVDTMHTHRGTTRLTLKNNVLSGQYYSGRNRKNFGILNFKRT